MTFIDRDKEKKTIQKAHAQGMSMQELTRMLASQRKLGEFPDPVPSFGEDLAGDVRETISSIGQDLSRRHAELTDIGENIGPSIFDKDRAFAIGKIAGAINDVIENLFFGGVKAAIPQHAEERVSRGVSDVLATDAGQAGIAAAMAGADAYQSFKQRNPDVALAIESAFNIAELATFGAIGTRAVSRAGRSADDIAEEAGEIMARRAAAIIPDESPAGVGVLATEAARRAGESVLRVPSRIGTAADAARATRQILDDLPDAARIAVTDGLDLRDVRNIVDTTPAELKIFSDMLEQADGLVLGTSTDDPASIVGDAMRKYVDDLDDIREVIGKELGDVVRDLQGVDVPVMNAVMRRLQEVPALRGLTFTDGVLDWSNTRLRGIRSAKDRRLIEDYLDDLVGANAYQAHLTRQEIFDDLLGKKKALTELRGDTELAANAIRRGITDVLEQVDDQYRVLSQQYAQAVTPLNELASMMRVGADGGVDIFREKGAVLARRLTSSAPSGADLRRIMRDMRDQLAVHGRDPGVDVAKLQEFLNTLERYYDITKRTSFAGQVKLGVDKSLQSTITGAIMSGAQRITGITPEVSREAIRNLISSLSK